MPKAKNENLYADTSQENTQIETDVIIPEHEVKLTERVSVDNLVSWNLDFVAIESQRDITIPAYAKDYKQLTVAEVDSQIKAGNGFFCGTDGLGANANIKIRDKAVRKYVFGLNDDGEIPGSNVLDIDTVKELLSTSPKAAFEKKLKEIIVTEAQKKMIVPLAEKAGIENCESYKVSAIEKISGINFD